MLAFPVSSFLTQSRMDAMKDKSRNLIELLSYLENATRNVKEEMKKPTPTLLSTEQTLENKTATESPMKTAMRVKKLLRLPPNVFLIVNAETTNAISISTKLRLI